MGARMITATCEWCGEEFTYLYIGRGMKTRFCSERCLVNQRNRREGLAFGYSEYLKGEDNKLNMLLEELKEKGMDYSEYKKQLSLSKVEKIKV